MPVKNIATCTALFHAKIESKVKFSSWIRATINQIKVKLDVEGVMVVVEIN